MTAHGLTEIEGTSIVSAAQWQAEVVTQCRPVVIRRLVNHWPVVEAAAQSGGAVRAYLAAFDAGGEIEVFKGAPDIAGKYYYNADLTAFNFKRELMKLARALDAILLTTDTADSTLYVGAIPTHDYLPGFAQANPMPFLAPTVSPRLWLGHASNVAAHYDTLDNLACVIMGARRFTLFPPSEIGNLYVGPIDHTMAGQPVSLAASAARDDAKFPSFVKALDRMLVAELNTGDALYLPKLWWHKVESTAPINGLVNYWWDAFAAGPDSPYTSLLLSMITIAERPPAERAAWRAFFDHYVFRPNGHPLAHLPDEKHGLLGPLKHNYGAIRARVMHLLRHIA